MYYLYLLRCADNSLYCGQTNDLEKRVGQHSSGKSKSAKYTRNRLPIKLVYIEEYPNLTAALRREMEIKKMTKMQKEALVEVKFNK